MAEKLLANTVIEQYEVRFDGAVDSATAAPAAATSTSAERTAD
jgi:hypothetical protein